MTKMLTKQQIFDKVSVHLVKQNQICENDDGCRYHGPDNLRCAIGCLIPKKHYRKKMEENTITNLFVSHKQAMTACGLSRRYLPMLNGLNMIHDENGPLQWRNELGRFAREYKVSPDKFIKAKSK